MDRIMVISSRGEALQYPLLEGRTVIGSDAGCTICLPGDEKVAGAHAELVAQGFSCTVSDLGSAAGVIVNGKRVSSLELNAGDRISIGGYTVVCLGTGSAATAGAAAEPGASAPEAAPEPVPEPEPAPAPGPAPEAEQAAEPPAETAPEPQLQPEAAAAPDPETLAAPQAEEPISRDTPPAAEKPGDEFEATLVMQRRQDEAPAPGAADGEATLIMQRPAAGTAAAPAAQEPATEPEAAPGCEPSAAREDDRFAITSIMKVPKKRPGEGAGAGAAPDLEEGVIEIEIAERPAWTPAQLRKAGGLAAAAAGAVAALALALSPGLRASLTPSSEIRFAVIPEDAQVYVNGTPMPKPGSGLLRNAPAGSYSVKVAHASYPAELTAEVRTGLFRRRARVDAARTGIEVR